MARVLVTGATGFLGARVVAALLAAGDHVRARVRPGKAAPPGAEACAGDITDPAALRAAVAGMDAVVHCAARVATTGPWEEFAAANVRATRDLIAAAVAAGVGRVVHISSLSVYAVPANDITVAEDSDYESESDGRGHYSRSKLAADRAALYEARRGAPVVVLRPGLLYGPGRRPPLARQSFQVNGCKLLLARRGYRLPMTHVDNVADAVVLALRAPDVAGKAFTIVDDNIRQDEYTALYRAASGETWRPVYLPVAAVGLAARVLERLFGLARRRSPVTRHQIRRATDSATFDCTRARQLLGWQPRIDVAAGLAQTFATLRGAGAAPAGTTP
jgi:nucleoside-diphosphate-sugar epimerase